MRIHLEGMGLLGCLLAPWLGKAGHRVTWHDSDAARAAWPACTGAIFPCGGADGTAYDQWLAWWAHRGTGFPYPRRHFEEGSYWFNHRHPPHHGKYLFAGAPVKGLRRAYPPSLHVNAQTLVPAVRAQFQRGHRRAAPQLGEVDAYVVAHGFGTRLWRCLWGWTVKTQLRYDRRRYDEDGKRAAFYFREGRFVMAYAYPVPGEPRYWYAGSSLIPQWPYRLRELAVRPKFLKWADHFEDLSGGEVEVTGGLTDAALQGWRPAMSPHDEADLPLVQRRGKVITLPPLWHNGLRHFPHVLTLVCHHLEQLS